MSILSVCSEVDKSVGAFRTKKPVSIDDRVVKILSNKGNLDALENNVNEFNNFIFLQIMNQFQLQVDENKEGISW